MPDYRRAFIPGGSWFFTVNLLERRKTLLVDHIATLRHAVNATRRSPAFTIRAIAYEDVRYGICSHLSSCPALGRASTSHFVPARKTWMAGTSPAMTMPKQRLHSGHLVICDSPAFAIDAFEVLPDHLHAIWTLPPGDADFSTRWRLIKTRFARALPRQERLSPVRIARNERGIWQRRFWEHLIRDEDDYARHVAYCTSIRSSMVWSLASAIGRIRHFIVTCELASFRGTGPEMSGCRARSARDDRSPYGGRMADYA